MKLMRNPHVLEIYSETRKRKIFVATLNWYKEQNLFELIYDKKYMTLTSAIPLGPDLPLSKITHKSKGLLFSSLGDRIPSKRNPAYKDYCNAFGIPVDEKNPIILLGTIGKRGPSTFVFESVLEETENQRSILLLAIKKFHLTYHELSIALDINQITLQRLASGKSKDKSNLKLVELLLTVPDALAWQLQYTSRKLHRQSIEKFETLMHSLRKTSSTENKFYFSI